MAEKKTKFFHMSPSRQKVGKRVLSQRLNVSFSRAPTLPLLSIPPFLWERGHTRAMEDWEKDGGGCKGGFPRAWISKTLQSNRAISHRLHGDYAPLP